MLKKIAFASVGLALLASPFFVSAQVNLSASPTSGRAPLAVSFSYAIGGNISSPGDYSIDFGDSQTGAVTIGCGIVPPGSNACPRALVGSHTYTTARIYTAKLRDDRRGCAPVDCNVIGTATITVTDGTTDPTFSATPTSGTAPLAVSFTGSGLNGNLTYALNFGDRQSGSLVCTSGGVGSICTGSTSHTYASAGNYAAQLFRRIGGPRGPDLLVGTVTITVSPSPRNR